MLRDRFPGVLADDYIIFNILCVTLCTQLCAVRDIRRVRNFFSKNVSCRREDARKGKSGDACCAPECVLFVLILSHKNY